MLVSKDQDQVIYTHLLYYPKTRIIAHPDNKLQLKCNDFSITSIWLSGCQKLLNSVTEKLKENQDDQR
jgi:hypothetical protein